MHIGRIELGEQGTIADVEDPFLADDGIIHRRWATRRALGERPGGKPSGESATESGKVDDVFDGLEDAVAAGSLNSKAQNGTGAGGCQPRGAGA
jgi:hypothetical protein